VVFDGRRWTDDRSESMGLATSTSTETSPGAALGGRVEELRPDTRAADLPSSGAQPGTRLSASSAVSEGHRRRYGSPGLRSTLRPANGAETHHGKPPPRVRVISRPKSGSVVQTRSGRRRPSTCAPGERNHHVEDGIEACGQLHVIKAVVWLRHASPARRPLRLRLPGIAIEKPQRSGTSVPDGVRRPSSAAEANS